MSFTGRVGAAMNDSHYPAGSPKGGQFAPKGSGSGSGSKSAGHALDPLPHKTATGPERDGRSTKPGHGKERLTAYQRDKLAKLENLPPRRDKEKPTEFDWVNDRARAERFLASAHIEDIQGIGYDIKGASGSYFVKLRDPETGEHAWAVFKPQNDEASAAPDSYQATSLFRREVAAASVGTAMGLGHAIPPTTYRTHEDLGLGSIQLYDHKGKTVHDYEARGKTAPVAREALEKARVFDYVVGNCDRHAGNLLFHEDGALTLIDHGHTMPPGHQPYFRVPVDVTVQATGQLLGSTEKWIGSFHVPSLIEAARDGGANRMEAARLAFRALAVQKALHDEHHFLDAWDPNPHARLPQEHVKALLDRTKDPHLPMSYTPPGERAHDEVWTLTDRIFDAKKKP